MQPRSSGSTSGGFIVCWIKRALLKFFIPIIRVQFFPLQHRPAIFAGLARLITSGRGRSRLNSNSADRKQCKDSRLDRPANDTSLQHDRFLLCAKIDYLKCFHELTLLSRLKSGSVRSTRYDQFRPLLFNCYSSLFWYHDSLTPRRRFERRFLLIESQRGLTAC